MGFPNKEVGKGKFREKLLFTLQGTFSLQGTHLLPPSEEGPHSLPRGDPVQPLMACEVCPIIARVRRLRFRDIA